MALFEIKVELNRVAEALERIVYLLERLVYPPPAGEVKVQQATLDDLHIITPEDQGRIAEEQAAFAERYQVVPGSPAFSQALQEWEEEQRSIYGENWQAPEDWRAIWLAVEGGDRRKPAGSAGTATRVTP